MVINKNHLRAFTLIELIVVITILAVLGAIWYISLLWYAQNARNSSRVHDIRLIDKAMSLLIVTDSVYPLPDNPTSITYSGALAWTQGTFSTWALIQVSSLSVAPKDPLTGGDYSYSVSNNRKRYQAWAMIEWSLFSLSPTLVSQSYALSSKWKKAYVIGDYISYNIKISTWGSCYLLTTPSILLSDIPTWWALLDGGVYNYTYNDSLHIPNSYSGSVEIATPAIWFQTVEVLSSCSISSINDLELYIAQLSTAYQQLLSTGKYNDLIYNSNTIEFQLLTISELQRQWINVSQNIIDELRSPTTIRTFNDTFTDTNGTQLVWNHVPSPLESWSLISGWNSSAYSISWNTLVKNWSSTSLVYPKPSPIIYNANYSVSFDVKNFGWWTISVYLRYTDSNNYYRLDITATSYKLSRMLAGVESVFQYINETIPLWSNILFSVSWDALVLEISGIEKENIVAGSIDDLWNPIIFLQNDGASIDNYQLIYK